MIVVICFCLVGVAQSGFAQCAPEETLKLLPEDGASKDKFGYPVAISGTTAIVGSHGNDDNGPQSGSAYVFRYDGSDWREESNLVSSDGAAGDWFGYSVSIDDDVVVVGAHYNDDNGNNSGSAYVFRHDGNGWAREAKLLPSDGATNDWFGYSVSIAGNLIVVGAYFDDDSGINSGSAYVFRYDPNGSGQWVEEAKLIASDGSSADYFGEAVAINNNVIVVGAHGDDDSDTDSGSAYVFRYDPDSPGQWVQEAKLLPADGAWEDWFGYSAVSIDNDLIAVGAHGHDDNGSKSGSVYVFRYDPDSSGQWIQEAKLLASDGDINDHFGISVDVDENAVVAGAHSDYHNDIKSGSAYVFRFDGYSWIEETKLVSSDGAQNDNFGHSVSIDNNLIITGADEDDDNGANSGSAYLYDTSCSPELSIVPDPLIAGQISTFTADYMTSSTATFLAYSLAGTGNTYIPQLNITLDLNQPTQAGNTITSDIDGTAEWVLLIPGIAAGRVIWFQACQFELVTNVVATSIE